MNVYNEQRRTADVGGMLIYMSKPPTPWNVKARQLMRQKKMTGVKLAELIGKAGPTVSQYLSGQRMPPLPVLQEIANVLETTVSYLVEDDPAFAVTPEEQQAIKSLRKIPTEQIEIALRLLQSMEKTDEDATTRK